MLKERKAVGRLGRDSFAFIPAISLVSPCGVSPADTCSVCVWVLCEHLPRVMALIGDAKHEGKVIRLEPD